jgi:hypothetical protein
MEFVEYNWQRYTADEIKSMFWAGWVTWEAKPYDVVDESAFSLLSTSKNDNNLWGFLRSIGNIGSKWGQCGKFVNDYLQKIGLWRYYDNELSTKLNSVNDYTPQKWTIAVFDYWHKSSDGVNYGHVGIVTQVYDDGSFDVIDSNYGSDEKIQKRHINPWSSSLKWFFNPSKPPISSWSASQSSFVSGSIEWVPLAYERAVKNLVPAALQNSDKEREALDKIITNSYKWWIDQSEIALTYMGFDI